MEAVDLADPPVELKSYVMLPPHDVQPCVGSITASGAGSFLQAAQTAGTILSRTPTMTPELRMQPITIRGKKGVTKTKDSVYGGDSG